MKISRVLAVSMCCVICSALVGCDNKSNNEVSESAELSIVVSTETSNDSSDTSKNPMQHESSNDAESSLIKPTVSNNSNYISINDLDKTKSYGYYKNFKSMGSATLSGEIVEILNDSENVSTFKMCKDGKKIYIEMFSGDFGLAEYFDGKQYYTLNKTDKTYSVIDGLSYNFDGEINGLFTGMASVVEKDGIEIFTLSDVQYAANGDVELLAETTDDGVTLSIRKAGGTEIKRKIRFRISTLSDDDKQNFGINGYKKVE